MKVLSEAAPGTQQLPGEEQGTKFVLHQVSHLSDSSPNLSDCLPENENTRAAHLLTVQIPLSAASPHLAPSLASEYVLRRHDHPGLAENISVLQNPHPDVASCRFMPTV